MTRIRAHLRVFLYAVVFGLAAYAVIQLLIFLTGGIMG